MMTQARSENSPSSTGPCVLLPIGGKERFGRVGQAITSPLTVRAVAPDWRQLQILPEIEWSIVAGPPGADLGARGTRSVTPVDKAWYASESMRLPKHHGAWLVRASLVDIRNSVDFYFRVYSDGVVSSLTVLQADPTPIDRPLDIHVLATDWLGVPIIRAKLSAVIVIDDGAPKGAISVNARGSKDGRYLLRLPSRYAGEFEVSISDTRGECSISTVATFLPGAARKLRVRKVENPRLHAPYDRTTLTVDALDRFNNVTKAPGRLTWQSMSGRIERVAAESGAAGSAMLIFGDRSSATVTVRAGKFSTRHTVDLPGLLFRSLNTCNFTSPGQRFRFSVEVFSPAGGGVLQGIDFTIKQPATARRIAVRQPHPENGLPAATVSDVEDGPLRLIIGPSHVPLPEEPMRFVVAELEYECCDVGEACFVLLDGSMTIGHSPGRDHPLSPKMTEYCNTQKPDHPKRLCIQCCLVTKPDDPNRTLEKLKAIAQKQIDKAQEIFDKNLPVCCPKIEIKPCFSEFKWEDYKPLTEGDPRPGQMTGGTYHPKQAPDSDKTKDVYPATSKLKELLKKCRKPNCHTFYFLPSYENKYDDDWKVAHATTFSPNDYPETTGASGSGTGTLVGGDPPDETTMVHELGHLLIDLPRDEDYGDEHITNDPERVMYWRSDKKRSVFTEEECSHIFDNIDKYNGDCSK